MTGGQGEIYLAGGCFWGTEHFLKQIHGVIETQTGFANGKTECPSYEDVCRNGTGHAETVKLSYDKAAAPLEFILELFYKTIDPLSLNRQGNDVGTQYRSALFPVDRTQSETARRVRADAERAFAGAGYGALTTEIEPADAWPFWYAEEYHQQYLVRHPNGYCPLHSTGVQCSASA